jgi:PAS domain S-box-containing protein
MNTILKIIILLISITLNLPVLAQKPAFKSLTLKDGLSQNTVYAILQDSLGFLWVGTEDGLNKYDAYRFTVYRHDPDDIHSLSHNKIFAIYEDSNGTLWIGTGGGLNRFDRQQERFVHYQHDPQNPNSLSNNSVLSIYEDNTGFLWIGTNGGGVNQFDPQQNTFVHYQHENPHSLSHNSVWSIYQDKSGILWMGTDGGGLNKFDRQTKKFTHYLPNTQEPNSFSNSITSIYEDKTGTLWIGTIQGLHKFDRQQESFVHYFHDPQNPDSLSHRAVWAIAEDNMGILWVATDGGGLNQFDRQTETFVHYQHDPQNPASLSSNFVLSLYQDRAGTMWAGTGGGGLNQFNPRLDKFVHYYNEPNNPNTLNNNNIFSIYEDRKGLLWVGTEGGGLNKFDFERQKVTHYLSEPENPDSLSHNDVQSIYEDSNGILWVGTYGGGLNQFNREQNRFVSYQHKPDDPNSLANDYVMSIYQDKTGSLWIGTREGLDKFLPQQNQFVHYRHDPQNPNSLSHNAISSIYEDKTGLLWIGTEGGGLNKFDRQRFTHYQHEAQNPTSLSHNEISTIYEDGNGVLWIGTYGGGLNKFDRITETFSHYREKHGLANNTVYGILEDKQGNLWLSTNQGLSKFNPKTGKFRNYKELDGLQCNEFNANAYHKNRRGELFFGGINGFNVFDPQQIKDNPYIPPIVLTDFKIFNQSLNISLTQEISLSYQQSFFSFEFAALNFLQPEMNEYAYQLEGFDPDWNKIGTRRHAYYTNVPHGTYLFRVKGSNNDKVWNDQGTAIKITILPPPWKTWWAYTLYVFITLAVIVIYVQAQQRKLQKQWQELEREQKMATQLKETEWRLALENEKKLRQFLEAMPVGISVLDAHGKPHYINQRAQQFFGKGVVPEATTEQLPEIYQLYHADTNQLYPSENLVIVRALQGESSSLDDMEIRGPDKTIPVEVWGTPIFDDKGDIIYAIAVYQDITERKEAERFEEEYNCSLEREVADRTQKLHEREIQLRQARDAAQAANSAKSQFLANMSHELRTPLNAILGYTQLFKRNQSLMEKHGKPIETIYRSGQHLLTMINDILDLSKIEAGKVELEQSDFHLPDFLKTLAEMMRIRAQLKGLVFNYEAPSDLVTAVQGDEKRLRQILLNLLGNAIKFTEQGHVTLDIENQTTNSNHQRIRFQVKDSGIGISPVRLKEIFLPFHQVCEQSFQIQGTGLGLAISQKLVRLMGGELYVKSTMGQGSTFWFELDLAKATGKLETKKPAIIGFRGQKRQILIVDDNTENRKILTAMLQSLGFEVAEAADGREGIEKVTECQPDLILLDLVMPRMNGFEFIRHIRQSPTLKDMNVIAVSASAFQQTRQEIIAAGCNDFITKPFEIDTLLDRLQIHLGLKWIYKESKETESQPVEPALPLIIPPQKELKALLALAKIRNITGIRAYVGKEHDSQFVPYLSKVEQLANSYQFKQLIDFIESSLRPR